MYSLFIDTHMAIISVVLYKDGKVLDKVIQESKMSHSVFTMPILDEMMNKNAVDINDISEVIVVNGPGSFTGVRIGVTIAKTLAYLTNCKIKMISSLEVIAFSTVLEDKLVVVSEKNGKYVGEFDNNNKLVGNYRYLSNVSYEQYVLDNKLVIYEKVLPDYDKVYQYTIGTNESNVHAVNPIYIKDIEVVHG